MLYLSMLIKPTSFMCNLRCKYCFYRDEVRKREEKNPKFMAEKDGQILIDRAFEAVEDKGHIAFNFQGGEPSLIGLDFYRNFVAYAKNKNRNISLSFTLQTNGLLIDEKWCEFLKANNFLVGLSIDGNAPIHDYYRQGAKGQKTFEKALATKKIFDKYKVCYNVLTVLTKKLSKKPKALYDFIKNEKIDYLQIIPCLNEEGKESEFSINPSQYFSFHKEIFKLWLKDLDQGVYRSIKIIDDIVNFILYGRLGFCGMGGFCSNQNVIESNLDVYPCDFYALDKYKLGNLKKDTILDIYKAEKLEEFFGQAKKIYGPCRTCPIYSYCKAGCRRMKEAMYTKENGNFCGYREFFKLIVSNIDRIKNDLEKIRSKS